MKVVVKVTATRPASQESFTVSPVACLQLKMDLPPEVLSSMRFFRNHHDCEGVAVVRHGYNLRTNQYELYLQDDAECWIDQWQSLGFEISWRAELPAAKCAVSNEDAVKQPATPADPVATQTDSGSKWVAFDWEKGNTQTLPEPKKWILLAVISAQGDISVCVGFRRDIWKSDSVAFYSPSLHADSGVIFAWADILPETFDFPPVPIFNTFSTMVRQRMQKLGFCPDSVPVELILRHEKLNFTVEESVKIALASIAQA